MKAINKYYEVRVLQWKYNGGEWEDIETLDTRKYTTKQRKEIFAETKIAYYNEGSFRTITRKVPNLDCFKIFSNKGTENETIDCYTLILFTRGNVGEMFGFNDHPFDSFGQHCGTWKGGEDFSNLGKEIKYHQLSTEDAQRFVCQCVEWKYKKKM